MSTRYIFFFLIIFLGTALTAQPIELTVYTDTLHHIDHEIYGHFLERPSWGGEFGIEDAVDKETGELDPRVLQKLKGLKIPVLRFPGGTDIDYMDWTDMIDLPGRDERPLSYGHTGEWVTNRFGYDEFAELLQELENTEAIIPLNFFDAFLKRVPLDSAALHMAGLAAYANADTGQTLPDGMRDWPAIRTANGHPEPFDFKYFQIGNETWALWSWKKQLREKANIDDPYGWYVECATRYIELIEAIDPEIEIIVDYVNSTMLDMLHEALGDRVDYYVFHKYMPWAMNPNSIRKDGQKVNPGELTKEEVWNAFVSVPNTFNNRDMSSIGSGLIPKARQKALKIAVTEWNWNGWWKSVPNPPLKSLYAQSVGVAGFLHGMTRQADVIEIGCQSMLVGSSWGITGIRVYKWGTWEPYYLPTSQMTSFYAKNHGDFLLRSDIENMPRFEQPLKLAGIRPKSKVAYVDIMPTGSPDSVSIFFINRDFSNEQTVNIDLSAFEDLRTTAQHVIITGELDNEEVNPPRDVYIYDREELVELKNQTATIALPPRSVSVLHAPGSLTSVKHKNTELPSIVELKQNYPNPFNPSTRIDYRTTQPGLTKLEVFDITGRKVKTLVNRYQQIGHHQVIWDGTNDLDQAVPSGMYLLQLSHANVIKTKKIIKLE